MNDKRSRVPNPLLESLGDFIKPPSWPAILENNPLESFPDKPSAEERDEYLDYAAKRFASTRTSLRVASEIQSMMRAGYRERNPCKPENQRKIYQISKISKALELKESTFYTSARCMVVSGITNMGKSAMISRCVNHLPQVVVHGRRDEAHWVKQVQVLHLTVKMPADGSRGGLLLAILAALDVAVFSDHLNTIGRKGGSIEMKTIQVARLLALYSVGLIILEEMQAKNFKDTKYSDDIQLFFLGVLSFGIPMVLVGNPRAFESLAEFKQTESRFFSFEPVTLWPFHDYRDRDWIKAIAPAIWEYRVVDDAEPFNEDIAKTLWQCSGGIPGYARRLVSEIQKSILRRSCSRMDVASIEDHFEKLESFRQFRPLIEGLTEFDNQKLVESRGEDIPVSAFVQRWVEIGALEIESDSEKASPKAKVTVVKGEWTDEKERQLRKKKTSDTKKSNKAKRNARVRSSVKKDDLRHTGTVRTRITKGLEELENEAEEKRRKKSKKKPTN